MLLHQQMLCLASEKTDVYPFNQHTISCASASAVSNSQGSEDVMTRGTSITILIVNNRFFLYQMLFLKVKVMLLQTFKEMTM